LNTEYEKHQYPPEAVATLLHRLHDVFTVAYLDDWLIFGLSIQVQDILHTLATMRKYFQRTEVLLQPTSTLVFLGLNI
jgi:hypothetical protein